MTALRKIGDLDTLTLHEAEERIDDAEARGSEAFRDLAALVAEVYRRDLWKDAGHANFAEWCEARGKRKTWGYQLVKAAAFSATAENEWQARKQAEEQRRLRLAELKGLSPAEVVSRSRKAGQAAGDALRAIEEAEVARKLTKVLRKALELARRHSGAPEEHVTSLEAMLEHWRAEVETEERAAA